MNILIIGANGRIGTLLAKQLASEGHIIYAGARKYNTALELSNIKQITFDLLDNVSKMCDTVKSLSLDIIYFTAGSRGKNLLQIDAFGAVKTMQMAQQLNVKRFILLSSVFALQPEYWGKSFLAGLTNYNIAKYFADHWLLQSGLDYTILQPGALKEEEANGRVQFNVSEPMSNSIGNVVSVLSKLKKADNTIKKVITMADGRMLIDEAIKNV